MGIFQCHESWSANLLSKKGDFTSCHVRFFGSKNFPPRCACQWPAGLGWSQVYRWADCAGELASQAAGSGFDVPEQLGFFGGFPGMMLVKL